MKNISIVTACYNEEDNVEKLCLCVHEIMAGLPAYGYEHIFIDNASTDDTQRILRELAAKDKRVKVIINTRNFGHIRSPSHALAQAQGDAVISLVADFQDPPEMISTFLEKWEEGYKAVIGIKKQSKESRPMFFVRKLFYSLISSLSEVEQIKDFTGYGLYDKKIIDIMKDIDDPYPYFRGLLADIGYEIYKIEYDQPDRKRGITKNNFYTLYDMAMLGITNHSKVPLRLAAMIGFIVSIFSIISAAGYLIYKLVFWDSFNVGIAPLVIGLFFFSSVQLFFIGIIGEYIGSIHTQVLKRPRVIIKEAVNIEPDGKDR